MAGISALGDWSFYLVNSVHCLGLRPFLSNYSSVQIVYGPESPNYLYQGVSGMDYGPIGGGMWALDFDLTPSNGSDAQSSTLFYFPDGNIANASGIPSPPCFVEWNCIDNHFWEALGLIFAARYWLYLADFGQIYPTWYPIHDILEYPSVLPSTNNIFVNATLYELTMNIINAASTSTEGQSNCYEMGPVNPPWAFNISDNLLLEEDNLVVFFQNYYCQQRQLKAPINLLLNVAAADYALIAGAYNLIVLVASWIEKCRKEGSSTSLANLTCSKLLRRLLRSSTCRRIPGGLGGRGGNCETEAPEDV